MSVLLIHTHPYERSFCRAIAEALVESLPGEQLVFHDLYAESPDPLLTGAEIARRFSLDPSIQAYSNEVVRASLIVFVHPDWWSAPPALLKGWIERVFRPGIAYDWQGEEFEEKTHVPLLTGKRLWVFATTDREEEQKSDAIPAFWNDLAAYAGLELEVLRIYHSLRVSSHRERRAWLAQVRELGQKERPDD